MVNKLSDLELFTRDFLKVKNLGFQLSRRSNSTGIGKTFEDLLEIAENNKKEPDLHGFEIKSQRSYSSSYITLFTKSPTMPRSANTILRQKYGSVDEVYADIKVLHTSIFCGKKNSHSAGFQYSMEVDEDGEKIWIVVFDSNGTEIDKSTYYTFTAIKLALSKINRLAFVLADTKKDPKTLQESFHFMKAYIYYDFISFENFLFLLKNGKIMYDIRVGAYKMGKNKGKTHDHGSGFRIKKTDFALLYNSYREIE